MLTIGVHDFELTETVFEASLGIDEHGWRVTWSIEVRGAEREIGELTWEPHLSTHWDLRLPSPEALVGSSVGPLEDQDDEPVFMLYIFNHVPVIAPTVRFLERDGAKFHVRLEGAITGWAIEPQGDPPVPIVLDCWLSFGGVLVDEFHESKTRERLDSSLGSTQWEHIGQRGYRHHYAWRAPDAQQAVQGDGPASGGSAP
jgi:hypothetical protein